MSEMHYHRGCVWSCVYHVVWCVKYRRPIFEDNDVLIKYTCDLLKDIANKNNVEIIECNTDKDHVHILLEISPNVSISNAIKVLKGASARRILKDFSNLKSQLYGGHVWNPSYFISTVSDNTEENIRVYIEKQGVK